MSIRNYSNTAAQSTLSSSIGATDTSIALAGYAGDPTPPFTAALARGTASEEIVLVTAVIGSTVTVTRGYDGTSAQSQAAGATFQEVVVALDFREANNHVNATGAVHGTSSQLVGVSDTQTLTNKTLTAPQVTNLTDTGTTTLATADVATLTVSGVTTLATAAATLLTFAQQAADPAAPATAGSLDVFKRDDHGLYVLGNTTARRRVEMHWGAGTAYPAAGVIDGDTYRRTDLFCTMRYNGSTWVQAELALGTAAQRTAISTSAGTALVSGFRFHESDTQREFVYVGGTTPWLYAGGARPALVAATVAAGWTSSGIWVTQDASASFRMAGWVTNTNAFTPVGGELLLTLPAGTPPLGTKFHAVPVSSSGTQMIQMNINIDGTIKIARPGPAIPASCFWSFDNVTWVN